MAKKIITGYHVFIDTNVLVRLYALSNDTLTEVEKFVALIKTGKIHLLVTQQVVDERARNRDAEFAESLKRLEKLDTSLQLPRFAEHHTSSKNLFESLKSLKAAKTDLLADIRSELDNDGLKADKVIQELFDASEIIERTDDIIERAEKRRKLSNPPGKKDSLGDQINWEIMLDSVEEGNDLHIISHDGDFKGAIPGSPNFFLRGEWNHKKGASLYLYAGLAEFAKSHFPDIKLPSDALKHDAINKLVNSSSYETTHKAISELNALMEVLTEAEAIRLLKAVTSNCEISDIINDKDVKKFFMALFEEFYHATSFILDEELEGISEEIFSIL